MSSSNKETMVVSPNHSFGGGQPGSIHQLNTPTTIMMNPLDTTTSAASNNVTSSLLHAHYPSPYSSPYSSPFTTRRAANTSHDTTSSSVSAPIKITNVAASSPSASRSPPSAAPSTVVYAPPLDSNVPYPWRECKNEATGQTYFWNTKTDEISSDLPRITKPSSPAVSSVPKKEKESSGFFRSPSIFRRGSSNSQLNSPSVSGKNAKNSFKSEMISSPTLQLAVQQQESVVGAGPKRGFLMKQKRSSSTWKKEWFVLSESDSKLYRYKDETEGTKKGDINLTRAIIEEDALSKKPFTIQIMTAKRKRVRLCADSKFKMNDWLIALKEVAYGKGFSASSSKANSLSEYPTITDYDVMSGERPGELSPTLNPSSPEIHSMRIHPKTSSGSLNYPSVMYSPPSTRSTLQVDSQDEGVVNKSPTFDRHFPSSSHSSRPASLSPTFRRNLQSSPGRGTTTITSPEYSKKEPSSIPPAPPTPPVVSPKQSPLVIRRRKETLEAASLSPRDIMNDIIAIVTSKEDERKGKPIIADTEDNTQISKSDTEPVIDNNNNNSATTNNNTNNNTNNIINNNSNGANNNNGMRRPSVGKSDSRKNILELMRSSQLSLSTGSIGSSSNISNDPVDGSCSPVISRRSPIVPPRRTHVSPAVVDRVVESPIFSPQLVLPTDDIPKDSENIAPLIEKKENILRKSMEKKPAVIEEPKKMEEKVENLKRSAELEKSKKIKEESPEEQVKLERNKGKSNILGVRLTESSGDISAIPTYRYLSNSERNSRCSSPVPCLVTTNGGEINNSLNLSSQGATTIHPITPPRIRVLRQEALSALKRMKDSNDNDMTSQSENEEEVEDEEDDDVERELNDIMVSPPKARDHRRNTANLEKSPNFTGINDKKMEGNPPEFARSSSAPHITWNRKLRPSKALKALGSDMSISEPSGVVQTGSFLPESFTWVNNNNNTTTTINNSGSINNNGNDNNNSHLAKTGIVERQDGSGNWKLQWAIVDKGNMRLYNSKHTKLESGQIVLKHSIVEQKQMKPKKKGDSVRFCFQISCSFLRENFLFSTDSQEELDEWMTAIKVNGALDAEFTRQNIEWRQKKAREDEEYELVNAKAIELKDEDDYIKNRKNEETTARKFYREKAEKENINPATCDACVEVVSAKEEKKEVTFKVKVTFGSQQWYIVRSEKDFLNLYSKLIQRFSVNNLSTYTLKNHLPKYVWRKSVQNGAAPEVNSAYEDFLERVLFERHKIFHDRKSTAVFVRFIAPVRYGDEKTPEFVMPFSLELF